VRYRRWSTAIALTAIAAGCGSPTPWEEHGEARWGEDPLVVEVVSNVDDVVEGYNLRFDYANGYEGSEGCTNVQILQDASLAMIGLTILSDDPVMRKLHDQSIGELLATDEWMELNGCPEVEN
jgi:hypothetical protein